MPEVMPNRVRWGAFRCAQVRGTFRGGLSCREAYETPALPLRYTAVISAMTPPVMRQRHVVTSLVPGVTRAPVRVWAMLISRPVGDRVPGGPCARGRPG